MKMLVSEWKAIMHIDSYQGTGEKDSAVASLLLLVFLEVNDKTSFYLFDNFYLL